MDASQSDVTGPADRAESGRKPEEIERAIDQTRARIDLRVGAIQEKLTVRNLADEFVDMLAGGAGAGSRRAIQGIRDNPVPAALVGAAVAWLLIDRAASRRRGYGRHGDGIEAQDRANRVGGWIREKGHRVSDAVGAATEAVREGATSLGERASHLGARAGEEVRERTSVAGDYMRGAARRARDAAHRGGRTVAHTYEEQPLLLGAAAFAVGLVAGLAIPSSPAEKRIMGRASRELKSRALSMGDQALRAGKRIASHVAEAAKEGARHGDDLGSRLGSSLEAAADAAAVETKQAAGALTQAARGDEGRPGRPDQPPPGQNLPGTNPQGGPGTTGGSGRGSDTP